MRQAEINYPALPEDHALSPGGQPAPILIEQRRMIIPPGTARSGLSPGRVALRQELGAMHSAMQQQNINSELQLQSERNRIESLAQLALDSQNQRFRQAVDEYESEARHIAS